MKTKIIERDAVASKREFPLVAISEDGTVVLFTDPTTGTVIVDGYSDCLPVGTVDDDWTGCFTKSVWTIPDRINIEFDNTK